MPKATGQMWPQIILHSSQPAAGSDICIPMNFGFECPGWPSISDPAPPHEVSPAKSARFILRDATAEAHERLDRLYSRYDLSRADDYGAFLLAHAPAFLAVENALEAAGAADIVPGWRERRRADALRQDIAGLGLALPPVASGPAFGSEPEVLGAAYVLEGSRLGAAMLIRTVGAGLPTAFLSPGRPSDWRAFIDVLEDRLGSETRLGAAVAAARSVFALFEQFAQPRLEPARLDY